MKFSALKIDLRVKLDSLIEALSFLSTYNLEVKKLLLIPY